MAEFGERIWYRPARAQNSLQPVVQEGYYLGIEGRSDESIIGTKEGPVRARDVWARPIEEKWTSEILNIDYTTMKPNRTGRQDQDVHRAGSGEPDDPEASRRADESGSEAMSAACAGLPEVRPHRRMRGLQGHQPRKQGSDEPQREVQG